MKETLEWLQFTRDEVADNPAIKDALTRAIAAEEGRFGSETTPEYEGFRFTHDGAKHMCKVFDMLREA